jgi:hypothetical protein
MEKLGKNGAIENLIMPPHQTSIMRQLNEVVYQRRVISRYTSRGRLSGFIRPRPPLIWGGTLAKFPIWWGACILGSLILPLSEAIYFNLHGHPLPGGVLNVLLFVLTTFGGPAIAIARRFASIRRRKEIGGQQFLREVCGRGTKVPGQFAIAARESLAASYCVPAELIGPDDSRNQCRSLSLLSEPLAVEVIAGICSLYPVEYDYPKMNAAAECFRRTKAKDIAELLQLLYKGMLNAGIAIGDNVSA